jgi:hypothetical protein
MKTTRNKEPLSNRHTIRQDLAGSSVIQAKMEIIRAALPCSNNISRRAILRCQNLQQTTKAEETV